MAFNPECESYSGQGGCAVIYSSCICVLSLFEESTGDEIFSLRLQYKGKQIQIAKMGRSVSKLLSFAKSDPCQMLQLGL